MFKSIRSKLVGAFALFIAGFVILQMLFNLFFSEKLYIWQKKNEINQVYSLIKNNYSDNPEELYSLLNKHEEKYNVRVVVLEKLKEYEKAQLIYASIPDWQVSKRHFISVPFSRININTNFSEKPEAKLLKNPRRDSKQLLLSGLIKTKNGDRYVFIESSVASIKQTVAVTTKTNFFLLLVLITIGMIYFYLFARKLTKPIKEIDEVAQGVVNLDFTKKAEELKGDDEISHLASNINIMSDRIHDMIDKLKQDIELKTKQENIRKEFVANVSHELKTPIALLLGYTEMLKSDLPGVDKDFYYDVIMDESKKMNGLVTELLDVSKLENELITLNYEKVDLYDLILWTIEKNKLHFEREEKEYSFFGDRLLCDCDKLKIEQAITNYITNAIFHSEKGSKIIIKLYKEDENAVFSVYNEGSHIDEKNIEKIWNIFYKVDESRSERKSTGIGLYIVSSVINAHKGEYGARNNDNGVEFYFKIKLGKMTN